MGKGSSGGQNTNTVVQQQQLPPQFLNAYSNLVGTAQTDASIPYTPYSGTLVQPLNANQYQAIANTNLVQGLADPFRDTAGTMIQQAQTPLWPTLPSFNTSGLPTSAIQNYNTSTQLADQSGNTQISNSLNPYNTYALGAANQLPADAAVYAGYASQPVNTQPYTGFGLGTAQGIQGQVSPYTGLATSYGSSIPGAIAQGTGIAGAQAQYLPGQVSPYTTEANVYGSSIPSAIAQGTGIAGAQAQNLPGQVSPYTGLATSYGSSIPSAIAQGTGIAGAQAQNLPGQVSPYTGLATSYGSSIPGAIAQGTGIAGTQAQNLPGQVSPYTGLATQAAGSAPGLINSYLSPYTQNVTSSLQNLFNQQNATQQSQVIGNAAAQGAFGGDRSAVAQALTAQGQTLAESPQLAQALQTGYQSSLQAAQQQAALQAQTGLGAGQLTSSAGLGAGQLGLGQAQALTQGYGTAGQLGLGAGQLTSSAGLGAGQLGLGQAQALTQGYGTAGQLGLGAGQLTTSAGLGAGQLGLGQAQALTQGYGTAGQLGLGAGQLTTSAGLGAGQLGLGQAQALTQGYGTAGQLGLGAGQLTSSTGLGAGQLGVSAGQLGLQGQLGQGQLGLGAGQLLNQALTSQGQLGLGTGQLTESGLAAQGQLGLGAAQANIAAGQGLFNEYGQQQQTQLSAEQANAWLASQGAFAENQLGTSSQQMWLTEAQQQAQMGAMQQQAQQAQDTAAYQQFQQGVAYPFQTTNFLAPIVEGLGAGAGGTSSTSYPGASTLSQIAGLGLSGVGAYGLLNNAGAFGSGAAASGAAGLASTLGAVGDYASPIVGGLSAADLLAAPFVKRGGRIGYDSGGTIPGILPSVDGLGSPPNINLDYLKPLPSPGMGRGLGLPRPPSTQMPQSSSGFNPTQIMQDLSSVKSILGQQTPAIGDWSSGATSGDWSSGALGGSMPNFAHPRSFASPRIGSAPHMGLHLGLGMRHPGLGARFDDGGDVEPLVASTPLSGASPNIQGLYQRFSQMTPEQLQELSVRLSPQSEQGQLAQRALMAKRMTPAPQAQLPQPTANNYLPLQNTSVGGNVMPANAGLGFSYGGAPYPIRREDGGDLSDALETERQQDLADRAGQALAATHPEVPSSAPPPAPPAAASQPQPPPTPLQPPPFNGLQQVEQYWRDKGASPQVAKAWAAEVNRESGGDPTKVGDSGTSSGAYQEHGDRQKQLLLNIQNDQAFHELMGGDKIAAAHRDEIMNAPNQAAAQDAIKRYFFRPAAYNPSAVATTGVPPWGGGLGSPPLSASQQYADQLRQSANAFSQQIRQQQPNMVMPHHDTTFTSPWMIPLAMGAGMLASRSPQPGVAIGEGLETGLKLMGSQAQERDRQDLADVKAQFQNELVTLKQQGLAQQGQRVADLGQRIADLDHAAGERNATAAANQERLSQKDAALAQSRAANLAFKQAKPMEGWQIGPNHEMIYGLQVYNPDTKIYDFHPGSSTGRVPTATTFQTKEQAYKIAHPGASDQEALDWAAGKKQFSLGEYGRLVQVEEANLGKEWDAAPANAGKPRPPSFLPTAELNIQHALRIPGPPGASATSPQAATTETKPKESEQPKWTRDNPLIPKTQKDINDAPSGSVIYNPETKEYFTQP